MKIVVRSSILVVIGLLVTSCIKPPYLTLNSGSSLSFTDQGGTQSISFSTNREWTVSSTASWCKASSSSGAAENGVKVSVICEPNTTYDSRSCTLTIGIGELSETINVLQDSNYGVVVSPTSVSLMRTENYFEIDIQSNIKYSVSVDDGCEWLSMIGGRTKALSSNKYGFKVSANNTYSNRTGKIYVLGENNNILQIIDVSQSQTDGLIVSETSYEIGNGGGDIDVKLQTNIAVDVIIPDSAKEWLFLKNNSTRALSDKNIVFSVSKNETYYGRSADIVLKGNDLQETITVSQAQSDAMFITNEKEFHFAKAGGEATINLFYNVDHIVDGSSIPSWITFMTKDVDNNNRSYLFSVATNTEYCERNAEIVFKSKDAALKDSFTVSQDQVNIVYANRDNVSISSQGEVFSIILYSNVNYSIEKPDWVNETSVSILETKPLQTTYVYYVAANDGERVGEIKYAWKDGDIERQFIVEVKQNSDVISVELTEPGTLLDKIGGIERRPQIKRLTISGPINGTDILTIRKMYSLMYLNMLDADIVAGGDPYYENYTTENNVIGKYMFSQVFNDYSRYVDVVLPRNITVIDDFAFYYNESLFNLTLPSTLTRIGICAFSLCNRVQPSEFPEGLEVIDKSAFSSVVGGATFKVLTLPSTLSTIGNQAFEFRRFSEIHIKALPSTLSNIGVGIFYNVIYPSAKLFVPKGTKETYSHTIFGNFEIIIEE